MTNIELLDLRDKLQNEYNALMPYLLAKFNNGDWHGVQDSASDLRDIATQLKIIDEVLFVFEDQNN